MTDDSTTFDATIHVNAAGRVFWQIVSLCRSWSVASGPAPRAARRPKFRRRSGRREVGHGVRTQKKHAKAQRCSLTPTRS